MLGESIDPGRFRVANHALGGGSSRTYRTDGLRDKVLTRLRPGDVVLIQFGHNDGGPLDGPKARESIERTGTETRASERDNEPASTVHADGW